VLWKEQVPPLIAVEMVSGDGKAERNSTPITGKLWVYEHGIRIKYYIIIDAWRGILEVRKLVGGSYQLLQANERGNYPIEELGVEIGMWFGEYENMTTDWLRFWDSEGNLLLTSAEYAEQERIHAELSDKRAELSDKRAELAEKALRETARRLLSMGMDINTIVQATNLSIEQINQLT